MTRSKKKREIKKLDDLGGTSSGFISLLKNEQSIQKDRIESESKLSKYRAQSSAYPPPFPTSIKIPENEFLRRRTPFERAFDLALETSYEGFVCDLPNEDNQQFPHTELRKAFMDMDATGYFRTDVTQPFGLGTKCAKTYVTRCLLGDPGTTYKYLGLRMFAHPWNAENQSIKVLAQLNDLLTQRSSSHLRDLNSKRKTRGIFNDRQKSAGFDVTLINKMTASPELKKEPVFGNETCSVSWHADSSLEHYSTIAVYHTLFDPHRGKDELCNINSTERAGDSTGQWSVALRVAPNAEGPNSGRSDPSSMVESSAPPIAVSLPSGSAYYLLDDFNHHHQHAVLAPTSCNVANNIVRFSSTHRKLRNGHTVQHILQQCASTVSNFHRKGLKVWKSEQLLLTELECEWIRQFYIQGQGHKDLLWHWWETPINQLLKYWSQLESRTFQVLQMLKYAAEARCHAKLSYTQNKMERKLVNKRQKALVAMENILFRNGDIDVSKIYDEIAVLIDDRAAKREQWRAREEDPVFDRMPQSCRPLTLPLKYGTSQISSVDNLGVSPLEGSPVYLRKLVDHLKSWNAAFISKDSSKLPREDFSQASNCPQDGYDTKQDGQNSMMVSNSQKKRGRVELGDGLGKSTQKRRKKRF